MRSNLEIALSGRKALSVRKERIDMTSSLPNKAMSETFWKNGKYTFKHDSWYHQSCFFSRDKLQMLCYPQANNLSS